MYYDQVLMQICTKNCWRNLRYFGPTPLWEGVPVYFSRADLSIMFCKTCTGTPNWQMLVSYLISHAIIQKGIVEHELKMKKGRGFVSYVELHFEKFVLFWFYIKPLELQTKQFSSTRVAGLVGLHSYIQLNLTFLTSKYLLFRYGSNFCVGPN